MRVALYCVFGARSWRRATIVFDYAKVRAVVEDRRSMLGAIGAALGFIRRNAAAAVGAVPAEFRAVRASWSASTRWSRRAPAAPGCRCGSGSRSASSTSSARLWVKLVFWASETALFQSRLAHAGLRCPRRGADVAAISRREAAVDWSWSLVVGVSPLVTCEGDGHGRRQSSVSRGGISW